MGRKASSGDGASTAERVQHIERLMASGLYRPGMTPGVLAEKWGISRQTVANLACEASRNIRREIGHCEDIRARMIATLSTITAESIGSKKYRDAIEAVRVMSGVVDSDERSTLDRVAREAEAKEVGGSERTEIIITTRGAPATVSVTDKSKPE